MFSLYNQHVARVANRQNFDFCTVTSSFRDDVPWILNTVKIVYFENIWIKHSLFILILPLYSKNKYNKKLVYVWLGH